MSQITDEKGETIRIFAKKKSVFGTKIVQHKGDIVDWTGQGKEETA